MACESDAACSFRYWRLIDRTGVRQLALYHLVPAPQNALVEKVFSRGLPHGAVLTRDGMMFELAADGESVVRVSQ